MFNKLKKINESDKFLVQNLVFTLVVRGLGLVASFFTIPIYLDFFKDQKILGIWFTLLSFLTWILTFDLGIGNGLRNKLVKPLVDKDETSCKKFISSTYVITGIITIISSIFGMLIFPLVDWNKLLKIPTDSISGKVILQVVLILFVGVLAQFFLKTINSIFYALQMSAIPSFLGLITSISILLFMLFSPKTDPETDFIRLAFGYTIASNAPLIVASFIIFRKKLKSSRPNLRYFDKEHLSGVLGLGITFFWLQLMSLVLTSTNEFLITWLASPEYVVKYQIYFKVFSLVGTLFTLAMTPIWSAVTKAKCENNISWIKKLYSRIKLVAVLVILAEFLMVLFMQQIINVWLQEKAISIDYLYALLFAASGGLYVWHSAVTSIVNGTGKLKIQFILLTLGGIINIPVAYILYQISGLWISVVIANIISLIPYCIIQPIFLSRSLRNET